jgi:hypothetical protein
MQHYVQTTIRPVRRLPSGLIRGNPCRVKGADKETSPERPVLTVAQVFALADAIGPRYGALVLLATFLASAGPSWPRLARKTSTWTRAPYG